MRSQLSLRALILVALLAAVAAGQQPDAQPKAKKKAPVNLAYRPVEDQAGLPRVLLIGDSISIGYTVPVQELLRGKANVHRPPTNCGPTTRGLDQLDRWLGDKPWDVIHFNWGLHDLKYMGPNGENLADPAAPTSKPQVALADYERNLRTLVARLKPSGARLIWCATTPVPDGARGRLVADVARYNEVAARVMRENDVAINDLYAFALPQLAGIQKPADVHYTPDGSRILAEQVAKQILDSLER